MDGVRKQSTWGAHHGGEEEEEEGQREGVPQRRLTIASAARLEKSSTKISPSELS